MPDNEKSLLAATAKVQGAGRRRIQLGKPPASRLLLGTWQTRDDLALNCVSVRSFFLMQHACTMYQKYQCSDQHLEILNEK